MTPRYVLFPGYIPEHGPGPRTYVTATELARHWGVPFSICAIAMDIPGVKHDRRIGDIELRPDWQGKYNKIPEPVKSHG